MSRGWSADLPDLRGWHSNSTTHSRSWRLGRGGLDPRVPEKVHEFMGLAARQGPPGQPPSSAEK